MGYSSLFRNRMNIRGTSVFDRALYEQQRQFDLYFENTLNKELVTIDDVEQYAVFQDQNQNNNKDLSDDKYMVVKSDSNVKTGSYVWWRDKYWLVFIEENKTVQTHKQVKVRNTNQIIKWMIDGKICNNGEGHPSYVQNNTLYTLGVSTSGNNAWIVNAKYAIYMQDNSDSRAIKIGQRLWVGGAVFRVLFHDFVSRKGLIYFLLEEDFVNLERDNAELEVADYYIDVKPDQQPISTDVTEVLIEGSDTAKIGTLVKYEAKVIQNGTEVQQDITEWTISDLEQVATIVEQTPTYITLQIAYDFKKVGSTISIIGKTSDGIFGSHSVRIVSPY
jgi:hypothetical protein